MARTDIPVQTLANFGAGTDNITWTAGDATNDHSFTNDGRTMLLMKCTDASPKTATVVSVAGSYGRTGDLTITCPATTGLSVKGPFRQGEWNQTGGVINVDLTDATGVSFAAVRLPAKS